MVKLKELIDECKGIMANGSSSGSAGAAGSTTISNRTINSSMSGSHGWASGFLNTQDNTTFFSYFNSKNQSDFLVFKKILPRSSWWQTLCSSMDTKKVTTYKTLNSSTRCSPLTTKWSVCSLRLQRLLLLSHMNKTFYGAH